MIVFAGCGALGSTIAMMIANPDRLCVLIDDDRVEERNISTSAYFRHHVGLLKVDALGDLLFRKNKTLSSRYAKTLTSTVGYIAGPIAKSHKPPSVLVVDTFDNNEARILTQDGLLPVVHVGISEQRTGSVEWNGDWVPIDGPPRGQNPVCTHHLGWSIIRATAAVAAASIELFLVEGTEQSFPIITEMVKAYKGETTHRGARSCLSS